MNGLQLALVKRARPYIEKYGPKWLLEYEPWTDACGCMGPQDGEPLCHCKMMHAIKEHQVFLVNHLLGEEVAIAFIRQRIIKALK